MKYKQLGSSGLEVSEIILGCMSFGEPGRGNHEWTLGEDQSRELIAAALDAGVTTFDTANVYSDGSSEEIVGRALGDFARREEVVIATKVHGRMRAGANGGGLSRGHILEQIDASLRRLGTDYIDLYQIHRFDPHTPIDETLEALNDLVRSGKVRYIGASSGWAWQMMRALSISERQHWATFVSMQNHYNAIYREEEREMLPFCREMGLGVIPWSPLARGLVTRPRPANASVHTPDTARSSTDLYSLEMYDGTAQWDVVDAIERVALARGVGMAEIALAWLLSRPGVTAPIIGATKLSHLESAQRAVALTLTAEEIAAIDAPYRAQAVKGHE